MKLHTRLPGLWQGFRRQSKSVRQAQVRRQELTRQLAVAHEEWEAAQQYFQTVTDPELVDHAIYVEEAARRKYQYLFRQVRIHSGFSTQRED